MPFALTATHGRRYNPPMLRVLPALIATLAMLLPAGVCYCPHDAAEAACECEHDRVPPHPHDDCPCAKSAEPTVPPAGPVDVPAADLAAVHVVPPATAAGCMTLADRVANSGPSAPLFLCHCVFRI